MCTLRLAGGSEVMVQSVGLMVWQPANNRSVCRGRPLNHAVALALPSVALGQSLQKWCSGSRVIKRAQVVHGSLETSVWDPSPQGRRGIRAPILRGPEPC